MMREVTAIAHGKVNLHLGVGALRDDGYHELVSIFQSLELRDVVTLTEASPNIGVAGRVVGLECATAGVPTDNTNLAWRAVDIVFGRSTQQPPAVRIAIAKGIPTAGGMAGGSADAAAALIAANKILDNEFELGELLDIAADLGSDVPFTLVGGTALGTGRGEHLVPTLSKGTSLLSHRPRHPGRVPQTRRTRPHPPPRRDRAESGTAHWEPTPSRPPAAQRHAGCRPIAATTATHNPQHRHGRRGARRHCFRVGPHLRIPMRRRSRRPGSRGGTIAQRKHRRHIRPGARRPPQRRISG